MSFVGNKSTTLVTIPDGSITYNALSSAAGAGESSLTQYFLPTLDGNYRDMYRSGWLPSWFNQQWGGSQWGTLPDGSFGSVATGNVQDNITQNIGAAGANYFVSQGFIVSETVTNPVVWLKLYKVGDAASNLTVSIRANSAGAPTGADLGSGTIAAKTVTSKTDGEWYPVTISGTYTANTQYHLLATMGTTAAAYYIWKLTNTKKYPHGYYNTGTSVPAWTSDVNSAMCFLIQNPAANSLIQSGGQFDYKLSFAAGSPVNQSRSVCQPLVNFYDGKNCTVLTRGTYAASSNVWDFTYGLDHDRITVTINGSGYPVLTVYRSDRTAYTVTGTGSVASGFHDVGIRVRTVGDGSDYATLYVDGVSVGTPLTAQTFTMDVNMKLLGTARLGDGFGLAPTWTQDMQMTSLPSAQGWTWAGTATEANAMSIQGGKLYQNANGYTSTQTGYYQRTTAFVNATGWTVSTKLRVSSSQNTVDSIGAADVLFGLGDGSKTIFVHLNEYFVQIGSTQVDFTIQGDFKSQEHVFTLCGKGSDYYLLIDGKLAVDGTGKLTNASGSNILYIGDNSATASDNADAIWSYVKYSQAGMLLPTAGSNTCSEFAHWSGDKSALFPSLYNSGTPVSVKQLCGVPRNYQFEQVVQREVRRGVTSSPTTTSTSYVLQTDMEAYVIGETLSGTFANPQVIQSSAGNPAYIDGYSDGVQLGYESATQLSTAGYTASLGLPIPAMKKPLGLHKIEGRWKVSAGTGTSTGTMRTITVEARS